MIFRKLKFWLLKKGAIYLVKVPESMDTRSVCELANYLEKEAKINPIIVGENISFEKLPDKEKTELLEYIKGKLGIKE